ncbi:DUF6285 domain-containing protein [Phenylobacterium zucineum]|uniref:DUF6285 domain-containing protein n=1 Tax=Phenylobacterium zucineum TaxID=284016 RepID=UPI0002F18A02|nr:DUF6285 domain-containing protein [Phenylobacterium zucineum]
MITHPKAEELTEAVAAWIEQIRPGLDPRNAFLARVAANALAAVTRELKQGPHAETAAQKRMAGLLGHGGPFEELNAELCERIRSGEFDVATPGLLEALRANTMEQLAIDQPSYRHEV